MRLFSDIEGLSMTFAFGATPIAAAITGQRAPETQTGANRFPISQEC